MDNINTILCWQETIKAMVKNECTFNRNKMVVNEYKVLSEQIDNAISFVIINKINDLDIPEDKILEVQQILEHNLPIEILNRICEYFKFDETE